MLFYVAVCNGSKKKEVMKCRIIATVGLLIATEFLISNQER